MLLLAWLAALVVVLPLLAVITVATLPFFGYESRVIMGGSMEPAVPVGAVIVSHPVAPDSLHEGDIVTYRGPEGRAEVTHRIVAVRTELGRHAFTLKGDANASRDPEDIVFDGPVSKMEIAVPYLGYVISFARRPFGPLVLLVVPAVSLGIIERLSKKEDGARQLAET